MGHFSMVGLGLEDYVSAEPRVILEALCLLCCVIVLLYVFADESVTL